MDTRFKKPTNFISVLLFMTSNVIKKIYNIKL
jgi:hypothetical protein